MTNCPICKKQVFEIQRLHESVRILNNRLAKASVENLKHRNWFDEYGSVLAVHKIGGFSFPEEPSIEFTITTPKDNPLEPKKV